MRVNKLFIIGTIIFIDVMFGGTSFAANHFMTVNQSEVAVGDKIHVEIRFDNIAAWNVHVKPNSDDFLTGCILDEADSTLDAKNTNKIFSLECNTKKEGDVQILLYGDVTKEDDRHQTFNEAQKITISKKEETKPKEDNQEKQQSGDGDEGKNKDRNQNENPDQKNNPESQKQDKNNNHQQPQKKIEEFNTGETGNQQSETGAPDTGNYGTIADGGVKILIYSIIVFPALVLFGKIIFKLVKSKR